MRLPAVLRSLYVNDCQEKENERNISKIADGFVILGVPYEGNALVDW